jgi:hypothetical protein
MPVASRLKNPAIAFAEEKDILVGNEILLIGEKRYGQRVLVSLCG